ncbi:GSCFA domain-containing protein [Paracoccus cavernae]|uniref:GSCFA domain-containing protein n=1 Tax=Paracoccus cavernae TaxID=1571207 RepID=A0ABT8DBE5_9RHOB|nr:GSCFA domain-containing protein [Paracoccus cavernae]
MDDAIATAGSCFAQYIGRRLRRAGLNVLDAEPAPRAAAEAVARDFGYGIYSARYGNIYSARHFVQLLRDALTDFVDPAYVWDRHGRYFDALRPVIEPDGFVSVDEALAMRRIHLAAVRSVFTRATCVFFTLGLTECWVERRTGRVFPTCPGVVAGHFDPALYEFVSLGHDDVLADLAELRDTLKALHPAGRLILSVSPVPLTATVSGQHVLVATNQSKAVLRVAAGAFAAGHADVDYFPSYEIVNNPAAMGSFFAPICVMSLTAGWIRSWRLSLRRRGCVIRTARRRRGWAAKRSTAIRPIARKSSKRLSRDEFRAGASDRELPSRRAAQCPARLAGALARFPPRYIRPARTRHRRARASRRRAPVR